MTRTPASKAMRSTPTAEPKPPCANSQPRPSPAASPARGPSQRFPAGWGAAAGCGCCAGGVACLCGAVICRWAPRLRPPPSLAACASSTSVNAPAASAISETMKPFMVSLLDPVSSLVFVAPVQGDDPRAQVEVFDFFQARPFEHSLEAFLVGMHADRLGEIAVRGLVAGDLAAQPGQHGERVPVVDLRERRPHARELEHEETARGLEHAAHLGEGGSLVGHVPQSEGDADAVEIVR